MQFFARLAALPLLFMSLSALAADGHCTTRIKQTSVDFPSGSVLRKDCRYFPTLSAKEVNEEQNECESKSRKNRVKEWKSGRCPVEGLISTCTFDHYGEVKVKRASVIHVYQEIGGNLSLESELRLAQQQCNSMTGHSGKFSKVPAIENNNVVTKDDVDKSAISASSADKKIPADDAADLNEAVDKLKKLFKLQ